MGEKKKKKREKKLKMEKVELTCTMQEAEENGFDVLVTALGLKPDDNDVMTLHTTLEFGASSLAVMVEENEKEVLCSLFKFIVSRVAQQTMDASAKKVRRFCASLAFSNLVSRLSSSRPMRSGQREARRDPSR